MATIASGTTLRCDAPASDHRFATTLAIAMAVVVVAGFSMQLAMGRSSFGAPPQVHAHAVVFMGWVALFVAQTWLATRGLLALHRRLGWIAVGWMALMVVTALTVVVGSARDGTVAFFFAPQHFLIANSAGLACFVALTGALRDRRRLGRAHPAWWWGIGAITAAVVLANLLARSPLGDAIYANVTAGSPGASVPGLAYPPPPPSTLLPTGR